MAGFLYRMGRFAARRRWLVIGFWVVAAVAVIGASSVYGKELEETFEVPGLDSQLAAELLIEAGSDQAGITARVVATPHNATQSFLSGAGQVDLAVALTSLQRDVAGLPNVLFATDPGAALADDAASAVATGLVSPDGRVAIIHVQYPVVESLSPADLEELKSTIDTSAASSLLQIEAGGDLFFSFEEPQTGTGEMLGLIAAVVILLLAFGSVVAMGLPIGIAIFGLAVGVSAMPLVSYIIEIPGWAPELGAMIGMGVGIDYALFIVTRHREFLAEGYDVAEAAGRACATAGQAVVFAGGTVVIAILGLAVAGVPFMTAAGIAISIIVLIMVVASVTLLPALLGWSGDWINRLGIHRRGIHRRGTADGGTPTQVSPGWERWGRHVSRHPWAYAIGVTGLLLALSAPVLGLQLGFPDEGVQPESTTQRRAYDLVADGFGAGINGPLVIAVDIAEDPSVVEPLAAAIRTDAGVADVSVAATDLEAGVATLLVVPTTAPQDLATVATMERLRSDVLPNVLDGTEARAHVGGMTASFADVAERITDRLPFFVAAVIVLSFLLLMVVFRSILVPLKAALLNLLSIGAAYGVLVMVFQWGWGASLIGLETTVPIVSFVPMFMFAILFGLSMDYEVFLLSRVREHYLATGDNDTAVIHGIASTARVITSAALIMIAVFGGFVLGSDPVTKMFGLGLATAIFVDATIVRIVLVPATMKLMGDANWWLPNWLDRLLPNVDLEGTDGFDDLVLLDEPATARELMLQ